MLVSAILLGYGFFKWDWVKGADDSDPLTPYEIWRGKDDEGQNFTYNLAAYDPIQYGVHGNIGGFDDVRGVDRWLVFIPGAALVLGQTALLYSAHHLTVNRSALLTAIVAVLVAFTLVLFPFVWQSRSTSNWRAYFERHERPELVPVALEAQTDLYDSWEFVLTAGIGLLGAMAAVGIEISSPSTSVSDEEEAGPP